jgi:hypothetical protein
MRALPSPLQLLGALILLAVAAPAQGRQLPPDSAAVVIPVGGGGESQDSGPGQEEAITPRGALIRSLVVPGWGHATTGSYTRAGFYLTAQAGNVWMLAKTSGHLSWANRVLTAREAETRALLLDQGVPADSIPIRLRSDPGVEQARNLVEARRSQREDWIALALFFILIGGVDAFVSAHLQDFPEPLTVEPVGSPGGGLGLEVGVRIPWRGPGGG